MPDSLPAFTLRHLLERSAKSFADRPALAHLGEAPITYKELHESVVSLSNWLAEQGIGHGDTVAILSENSPQWGIAYLAITTMGAIAVPILTEFHSDAISHIIRHAETKIVFVSAKLFPKIEDTEFSPSPLFVSLETFAPIELKTKDTLGNLKRAGLREFWKWREKAMRLTHKVPTEPTEDDIAAIIYTSGTTGHSKGVMLTHKNIVSNTMSVRSVVELNEYDRMLSILPMPHTFECSLGFVLPILHGAQVFYLDKPPTARVLLPALAIIQPTAMVAVPLIIEKIFKNNILPKLTKNFLLRRLYAIPTFRRMMHKAAGKKLQATFGGQLWIMAIGGAPLATEVENFLREAEFPYTVGYGLTETSPILSGSAPKIMRRYSAGQPLQGVSLKIENPNPLTGEGEIVAKGPNVMKGYFKLPELTAESFTEDGWFKTGDLGYIDGRGFVYIKGRLKNMVLGPSGENIYPEEIESFLLASPYVAEALVYQNAGKLTAKVHLDTTRLDEEFAHLNPAELSEKRQELLENIRQEVNGKVSSFSRILRIIEQPEPFEKTPTQKIKRYLYINS